MTSGLTAIAVDAHDPDRLAAFWCDVLGWAVTERDDEGVSIGDPGHGGMPQIDFLRVPDPKTVKNRVHLDINARDRDQAAELDRLRALGAQPVDVGQGPDVSWHVLADPEGNEFCLLRRRVD